MGEFIQKYSKVKLTKYKLPGFLLSSLVSCLMVRKKTKFRLCGLLWLLKKQLSSLGSATGNTLTPKPEALLLLTKVPRASCQMA